MKRIKWIAPISLFSLLGVLGLFGFTEVTTITSDKGYVSTADCAYYCTPTLLDFECRIYAQSSSTNYVVCAKAKARTSDASVD